MDATIVIIVLLICATFVAAALLYSYWHLKDVCFSRSQESWRTLWRLEHVSVMRGNLIRIYNADINEEYNVDLDRELGKGGCGVVVVGHKRETRTEYAIKMVLKSTGDRGRLDREIKLLKDVDHANIVRLFEVYDTKTYMFFVMEMCSGGHLGELLHRQGRRCLNESWARTILLQLVSAVAHLHERGICHRDIKLQNILLENKSRQAQIKLIDFGFGSRYIGALPMHTKCGTPYTTAPEVLRECYDERCDVWSVGVVAFIVLSGKRPFEVLEVPGQLAEAGKAVMITNILLGRYTFSPNHWQSVSAEAIQFVETLLHPDYKTRVTSAKALVHPWLNAKDGYKAPMSTPLEKTKSARALKNMQNSSNASPLRRTGMMAVVFGMQPRQATDMRGLFQQFDTDSSGCLSPSEFSDAVKKIHGGLKDSDIARLFNAIDIDGNGEISFSEFLAASIDPRDVDIDELNQAFRLMDRDGSGFLSVAKLKAVLNTRINESDIKYLSQTKQPSVNRIFGNSSDVNAVLASEERVKEHGDRLNETIQRMVDGADTDGDGVVSYDEFLLAMTDPAFLCHSSSSSSKKGELPHNIHSIESSEEKGNGSVISACDSAGSFMKNMMPTASMLRTEHQKHQKKAMQYAIPGSPRACVADVDDSNSSENEQIRISPDNAARVFLTGSKKSSPTTASEHVTPTKLPIDAVAGANTTDDALWSTRESPRVLTGHHGGGLAVYDQIEDVEYCAPGANNGPQPAGKLFGSPPPIHTHTEQSPDDVVEPERRSIRISQRDREAIARSLESHKPKLESQRSIVDDKPKDTVKFLNHEDKEEFSSSVADLVQGSSRRPSMTLRRGSAIMNSKSISNLPVEEEDESEPLGRLDRAPMKKSASSSSKLIPDRVGVFEPVQQTPIGLHPALVQQFSQLNLHPIANGNDSDSDSNDSSNSNSMRKVKPIGMFKRSEQMV